MRLQPLAVIALLAAACATRPPEPGSVAVALRPEGPSNATPVAPPIAPVQGAGVVVPAAPPAVAAPPTPPAPSQGGLSFGGQLAAAAKPPSPGLPAAEGDSRTLVEGCLLAANEAGGAKFPPPPITRTAGPPPVVLSAVEGGVVLEHTLTHACCLTAKTTTSLADRVAVVTETLAGQPCRCRCSSKLRTAVRLPPGDWTLALDLVEAGATKRVMSQAVRVP